MKRKNRKNQVNETRNKNLTKEAWDKIIKRIREDGIMDTETAMELVRPHYIFDPNAAREQGIRRKAQQIMASIRDGDNVRSVFNCRDAAGRSIYVDIDASDDLNVIIRIFERISSDINGLRQNALKLRKRSEALFASYYDIKSTDK